MKRWKTPDALKKPMGFLSHGTFVNTVKHVKTNQNIARYNPDLHVTSISKPYSECDRYESVTCLYAKAKKIPYYLIIRPDSVKLCYDCF